MLWNESSQLRSGNFCKAQLHKVPIKPISQVLGAHADRRRQNNPWRLLGSLGAGAPAQPQPPRKSLGFPQPISGIAFKGAGGFRLRKYPLRFICKREILILEGVT